ncbi:MAG: arginine N-succinyltransferase [Alphaproteobacteria bacterium]|nr:MAG: arginine N-succinyltransferase [Caulobacteraceae bacterium]TPW03975.1 MAG: arginine N-succinyltransferase [Alphaproteobacteria bacterium]
MTTGAYVIRPARESDLPAFRELRELAGPGFTSLQADDAALEVRLRKSAATFAADIAEPGADQRYLLILEHRETGALAGVAGVKACVGEQPPFYNFRVLRIAQASAAANRRYDMEVLILVNEFTGCTEVGSLFVKPEHRVGGVGRMLAQARYMLMATAPQRFSPSVVSELRGVVDGDGKSPFWEHLGRHFFKMSFPEADTMSATTDNQFILDLMPKYPIYADLLPEEARAVIGKCHPAGEGALKLLLWEGFRYEHVVDIFDGGPLVTAPRDSIRTFRESRRMPLKRVDHVANPVRALAAKPSVAAFRCVSAEIEVQDGAALAGAGVHEALGLQDGETALIWCNDAR